MYPILSEHSYIFIASFYAVMSLVTFIFYAVDKSAARKNRQRVSEKTLHLLALFGGWPGAWLAQNKLRHKSSKTKFKIIYAATVILNLLIVVTLFVLFKS